MSFATSSALSSSRPEIDPWKVWCEFCNKPVDEFDESGMHNLWGKPDAQGYHRGYILIRAYCHGEESDIQITFTNARLNSGKRIVAFAKPESIALPRSYFFLPAPLPLLLMDGKQRGTFDLIEG